LKRFLVDTRYALPGFSRIAIDEVFHEERNVLSSLSKGRYVNRENMQAVNRSLHDTGLITAKAEPLLNNLHGDPRYVAFLKKLNFPN
jgi:hypothetical protein